jgi:glycine/D-amino acid oxidase-like deaminating enzyme
LKEISKGLNIYEHTFIKEIKDNTALYDGGKITAKKIVVATHFPFINSHGSFFLKLYQHRSYVLALKWAPPLKGMYVDEDLKGLSFRTHGNLLLFGGGSHRTGKKGGGYEELHRLASVLYPRAYSVGAWGAQDCMSLDGMPYIGRYSSKTQDLYTACGFNKWGMTSAMAAAMILSDTILGSKPDYAEIFSPSRSILKPQLLINGFESATHLLSPFPKRCTHLGCALKWNSAEHSWDCPCHGSRFTHEGKVINNPAMKDLKG